MMWLKHISLFIALLVSISIAPAYSFMSATAKITIKVVDEEGKPVEGARVGAGFKTVSTPSGEINTNVVKTTGRDGTFVGQASCDSFVGWNITKQGYYKTRGSYSYYKETPLRWEPWNPIVTSVLRKIANPVPMYIRNTEEHNLIIPEADKNIGFDLIKYDWIPPYGNGEKADLVFYLKRRYVKRTNYDFQLKIKFSNEYDGIMKIVHDKRQGSTFILPREAPLEGYKNEVDVFSIWNPEEPPKGSWDSDNHYIFRIRSKKDDNSISGIYGKIIGGIEIGRMKKGTASVRFKYFINPDGTRNLEHDPKRNLF